MWLILGGALPSRSTCWSTWSRVCRTSTTSSRRPTRAWCNKFKRETMTASSRSAFYAFLKEETHPDYKTTPCPEGKKETQPNEKHELKKSISKFWLDFFSCPENKETTIGIIIPLGLSHSLGILSEPRRCDFLILHLWCKNLLFRLLLLLGRIFWQF